MLSSRIQGLGFHFRDRAATLKPLPEADRILVMLLKAITASADAGGASS
jgi:hypothetical protein